MTKIRDYDYIRNIRSPHKTTTAKNIDIHFLTLFSLLP